MDNKIFLDLGLTEGEIKVYLALLKFGQIKTGPLVKASGVSSSKVYKILDRLENKGLVGIVVKSKVKYFNAISPKRLLEYFDEKQVEFSNKRKILEQIIPELELEQKQTSQTVGVIYEGYKAVTNVFKSILDDLGPNESYYVIGAGYGEGGESLKNFFRLYHQKRISKRIKVNMLANIEEKAIISKNVDKNSKIKYLPKYMLTNMQIVFYKNKVFFAIWAKDMLGIVIQNEEAVKSFKMYFDTFWKIAKD